MKNSSQRPDASIFQRLVIITAALVLAFAPGRALAQRPLGVDVSSFQGGGINWGSVKGSGRTFAWAKATEGTTITDGDFNINENNGKAAGVYMGAYHFAHPNAASPGSEAGHFWGVAGGYIKTDGKSLMPTLDFEVFSGVVGASSYSDWANQWCNAIVSDAGAAGVRVKPVLYTSACNACNFNSSVGSWLPWMANYNGQNPQTGTPWNTCTGCEVWGSGGWTAWQYASTGTVPGISGNVDHDVFNGSSSGLISTLVVAGNAAPSGHPNPAVVTCTDGHLEVFACASDTSMQHTWQNGPNGNWVGWGNFNVTGYYGVTAAKNADGRQEWFGIDAAGQVATDWILSDGTWSGVLGLGGPQVLSIAAATNTDGHIEVFAACVDGSIQHVWQTAPNGNWSGWGGFGATGGPYTSVIVGKNANGCLEWFAIGGGGAVCTAWQTTPGGNWSGILSLGGGVKSIAVTQNTSLALELFAVDPSVGGLWHMWQTGPNGNWGGWASFGGSGYTQIAVGNNADGRQQWFAIGTGGAVNTSWWQTSGSWSGVLGLGGNLNSICVGNNANGALEIFGRDGANGTMDTAWQNGPNGNFGGWLGLGGSLE